MTKQAGFTLIELIMVIVILGILAATALPKFVDLSADAKDAALDGVAGAISSANTINYANESLHPASGIVVTNCNSAGALLEGGALPPGYTPQSLAIAQGVTQSCTLAPPSVGTKATANYTLTGVL